MMDMKNKIRAVLMKGLSTTFEGEKVTFITKGFDLAVQYMFVNEFKDLLLQAGIPSDVVEFYILEEETRRKTHKTSSKGAQAVEDNFEPEDGFVHNSLLKWTTLDGRTYRLYQMETLHLINVRNYLIRKNLQYISIYKHIVAEIKSRPLEISQKFRIKFVRREP